eukprot:scaffold589_cov135-Skeletonema_marinoi.AAC.2
MRNEEEAVVDYARAVFKYLCQGAQEIDKARKHNSFIFDRPDDVLPQLLSSKVPATFGDRSDCISR